GLPDLPLLLLNFPGKRLTFLRCDRLPTLPYGLRRRAVDAPGPCRLVGLLPSSLDIVTGPLPRTALSGCLMVRSCFHRAHAGFARAVVLGIVRRRTQMFDLPA